MAYQWQTVESAAVTLGVSTRTLARRISDGKIESRLENGRREVLVCLPDSEESPDAKALPSSDVLDATENQGSDDDLLEAAVYRPSGGGTAADDLAESYADDARASASSEPRNTAMILAKKRLAIAEDRVRNAELTMSAFRQASEMACREVRRAKLGALCAWGTVAILSAGVIAAVGYTTAKVSRSQCQTEFLQQQLTAATTEKNRAIDTANDLRRQAEDSRIAAARTQGRLDAVMQEQAKLAAARVEGKSENSGGIKPLSRASQPTLLQRMASILDGPEK